MKEMRVVQAACHFGLRFQIPAAQEHLTKSQLAIVVGELRRRLEKAASEFGVEDVEIVETGLRAMAYDGADIIFDK